jgi:hypothetical protein
MPGPILPYLIYRTVSSQECKLCSSSFSLVISSFLGPNSRTLSVCILLLIWEAQFYTRTQLQTSPPLPPSLDIPCGHRLPPRQGFEVIFRHTTLGRTNLDEWSVRRRDPNLIAHNTNRRQTAHNTNRRQTSMSLRGIRTRSPRKRTTADPRLKLRCH